MIDRYRVLAAESSCAGRHRYWHEELIYRCYYPTGALFFFLAYFRTL